MLVFPEPLLEIKRVSNASIPNGLTMTAVASLNMHKLNEGGVFEDHLHLLIVIITCYLVVVWIILMAMVGQLF